MSNGGETDATTSPSGAAPVSENVRNWVDVVAKLMGTIAVAVVTYVAATYQSQAALSATINQREQAESQLRASMLSDLIEPIIGKNGGANEAAGIKSQALNQNGAAGQSANLEKQRLLAEMVTLNFHDHFEFKPLLQEVDAKLLKARRTEDHNKLASVARRVIDRQINMLTSIDGVSSKGKKGYAAKITRIDLLEPDPKKKLVEVPGNCITNGDVSANKPPNWPTLICLTSPDDKICMIIKLASPDYDLKSIVMGSKIVHPESVADCNTNMDKTTPLPDNIQQLDEVHISIFDFPLTDNSKIMWGDKEYRYSVSLYQIDNGQISLKLVWFPEGYVTERERPPPTALR